MKDKDFNAKDFKKPWNQYKMVPFWFLNDYLKPSEMRHQVREFAKKNVGGAFMHGRFGLRTPYFSKEWWECINAAVDEGKKLGFNLWIYDEMNFASGWAHGRIYEENPNFQEQHLDLIEKDVSGPLHFVDWGVPDGFPEYVYICKPDYSNPKEVTKDIWDWQLVTDIPEGPHKILFFMRRNSGLTHPFTRPAHIDRLNLDATKAFIRLSHEEYRKRFSAHFGKTIQGVFTDEPGFYHNLWNKNPASLVWTRNLPEFFRKRCGYDLKDHLICLWKDVGSFRQVRCDFYDTVAEMFCANYFKPISDWCRKNRLKFTGHLEWEEGFGHHIQFSGHLMKPLRLLDIPGIDKIDRNKRRLTEKIGSSVTHLSGKERTLSETYACSSWDLTLEEMKAVCDWQYARGVDFLNPHAFYYSIREERKFESHPSEGHNNIFWPHFKTFADYVTRLSYVLTRGKHSAPVALYYPIYTAWAMRNPDIEKNQQLDKFSDFFDETGIKLMENQIDFDVVDDGFLSEANIDNGAFKIAGEKFSVIMLAGTSVLPDRTVAILRKFVEKGGNIVVVGTRPSSIVHCPSNKKTEIGIPELFKNDGSEIKVGKGRIVFADKIEDAISILRKKEFCDLILKGENPNIKYLRRTGDGWDLYFVINESEHPAKTGFMLRGKGKPYLLDMESGKVLAMENIPSTNGFLNFSFEMAGFSHKCIFMTEKELNADGEYSEPTFQEIVSIKEGWTLSICGKKIKLDGLRGWEKLGYEFYSGSAVYSCNFSLSRNYAGHKALRHKGSRVWVNLDEVKEIAEVKINGKKCGVRCWRPFIFEITKAVKPGGNTLEVKVTNTQKNEFEKVARPSGLFGPVKILSGKQQG